MEQKLKILLLEDTVEDSELAQMELRREGLPFVLRRVETQPEFQSQLEAFEPDIIVSDYNLPGFNGLNALSIARLHRPDTPFIFFSGAIQEELAIESLKGGAVDYVLKDRPARLGPSVRHALEQAGERRKRKQIHKALRESEERYTLAVRGANDGLWDWNLRTNEIYFSPRWKSMLGYSGHEIDNKPESWFNRVHTEDAARLQEALQRHFAGKSDYFGSEFRIRHHDGGYRWMLCRGLALWNDHGEPYRIAGSQTDITEQKQAQERLMRHAFYDLLTGLPNRALLLDRIGAAILQARQNPGSRFAILLLDIDRFRSINESLGYQAGDILLNELGRRLQLVRRPSDLLAHLGHNEFALLLDRVVDLDDVLLMVDQIRRVVSEPFLLEGRELHISASVGIAMSREPLGQPDLLLREAETAMYRAKARGSDSHEVFDISMHERAVAFLQLEEDLRKALERNEFELHYQPIVSFETGQILAGEALVRWRHPTLGMIAPGEFIPVAEESGLIGALGEWCVEAALRQLKEWHDAGLRKIDLSINLSARQFRHRDVLAMFREALVRTGADPTFVKVELTESALIDQPTQTAQILRDLRSLGLRLSLDDFGTGYSALSYLKRFPFDTLKIDRSFVMDLPASTDAAALVTAIVGMAHALKLRVTAEGVETIEQLAFLRKLGCDDLQGYLFSRAVPAPAFARMLEEDKRLAVASGSD